VFAQSRDPVHGGAIHRETRVRGTGHRPVEVRAVQHPPVIVRARMPRPAATMTAAMGGVQIRMGEGERATSGGAERYSVIDAIREGKPHTPADHAGVSRADAAVGAEKFNLWYGKTHALHDIS